MTAGIHSSPGTGRGPALPPGRGRPPRDDGHAPVLPSPDLDRSPARSGKEGIPAAGAPASRVSVLAPRTRVDVALPPDVPVAELVPVLLDLAGEGGDGRAGGGGRGGWTLAPLGQGPAEAHRTLASLGVLDGDQLVLRRRADAAPPPLFDDVVDAVAEATPASFWAWGPAPARRLALTGLGIALIGAVAALAVAGRGPGTAGGLVTALVAGLVAATSVAVGAVCAQSFGEPAAGAVFAVGGAAAAGVCGVAAVPGPAGTVGVLGLSAPHLLLGAVLTATTAVIALLVLGASSRSGLAALVAVATAGALTALACGVATLADAGDPAAIAAGAGATALVAASMLPRASIALARLPLPRIPGSVEELADDPGVAEHAELARRTDRAHAAMTGLLTGCGAVATGAVGVAAAYAPDGVRGVFAWILAALLTLLLALRSRTYANGAQALALLLCALVAATTLTAGSLVSVGPGVAALGFVAAALALGGVVLLLGVAVPRRRFSPVTRRAVDVAEAIGVAAVLPIALAVMDLYTAMRLLPGG